MTRALHHGFGLRSIAQVVLSALIFLVVASYLAIPCLTDSGGMFQAADGPQACNTHKLFKPQADLSHLFDALPVEAPLRFLVVLAVLPAVGAFFLRRARNIAHPIRGLIVRVRSLPFATADPPKLPAFAALRDA